VAVVSVVAGAVVVVAAAAAVVVVVSSLSLPQAAATSENASAIASRRKLDRILTFHFNDIELPPGVISLV
jgi:hypothetical protein